MSKILDQIQSAILDLLVKLGIFTVPFMPAMFLGYAVYSFYKNSLGLTFGIVVAVVLEIVGIVIAEIGLETIDAWQEKLIKIWKAILMMIFMPVVAIIISTVVYFSEDAFPPVIKGLAIAGAFLATIVYVSIAIHRETTRVKERNRLGKLERKVERLERKAAQVHAQPLSKREQAIEQLEKNTEITERELAQILNISTGSAHNYKKAFEQRNGK